jgi:subtilisin family serine protease
MKLRFGKDDWLELDPVPLDSQVSQGVRTFALAGPVATTSFVARAATSRAAAVANRVTAQTFQRAAPSFPSPVEAATNKVETAVFRDRSGRLRVVYREVVLRFAAHTAQKRRKAVLDKFGLAIRDRNHFHKDQLIAYDPKRKYIAERMVELANKLTETDDVVFAFPNFVSEFKRSMAAPTPVRAQWHLSVVEARKAWVTTQGDGIVVAVLDDGVDVDHPNLKRNIKRNPDPSEPRDLLGRDFFVQEEDNPDHFNPRPKQFHDPFDKTPGNDIHGTCCAGVIAASGTGDVLGVAPKALILPIKIFHADSLATESRVADAIRYGSRFADILSCSWEGPASPDIEFALEEAGAGRGGKGCPIFCATGNEASPVGFPARSNFSIGVGASTDQEKLASYSNRGPQVSVVAPSSGGTKGIFTTDVSIAGRGYNLGSDDAGGRDGLNNNNFGGTSSATPLAAGIAALVLAANPKLSRGDVRSILEQTAVKIGPANGYDAKGHSNDFGFGRVNAAKAVEQALTASATAKVSVVPEKKKTPKKKTAKKQAARKKSSKQKIAAKKKKKAPAKKARAAKKRRRA